LIARGVEEHERSGQRISRITVSGGIARSDLMCEILASVLDRTLERLESDEGPALGAAVTALAAMETHLRRRNQVDVPYTVADAVAQLVRFRAPVQPNAAWIEPYRRLRIEFDKRLARLQSERVVSVSSTRIAAPSKKSPAKPANGAKRAKASKRRR
jgi:xylulokinase